MVNPTSFTLRTVDRPNPQHNRVSRIEGNYNLLDPSEVSPQYCFRLRGDAPNGVQKYYGIRADYDPFEYFNDDDHSDNALEVARELKKAVDRYAYNSDKARIPALIAYLEQCEAQDKADARAYKIAALRYEIEQATAANAELEAA